MGIRQGLPPSLKEIAMSEKEKKQPSHQVSFARNNGQDHNGKTILGPARQIGSIWPRDKEGEGILRLDITPREMFEHNGGVIFVRKLEPRDAHDKSKRDDHFNRENGFDREP
jgi:hypothetical protein